MSVRSRPRSVLVNRCFLLRGNQILLLRRASTDVNNAGRWEGPGGKVDEGQDLMTALEREVMEETGLLIRPTHPCATHNSFLIGKGKYRGLLYLALFSVAEIVGGKLKLSAEHSAHSWEPYDKMLDYDLTDEVRKAAIQLEKHLR